MGIVSSPILHDIIKSELNHNPRVIYNLCREIHTIKNSNLFKKDYWQFEEARQEQLNIRYYQADGVWFFNGQKNDNYYIVHEVKTGGYDIDVIYKKYRTGMSGQIWIWGWKQINDSKTLGKEYQRKIKLIDIEYLKPILINDLNKILAGLIE